MAEFVVKLAGVPLGVRVVHPSIKEFCAGYLTGEQPVCQVEVRQADVDAESVLSRRQRERECLPPREYSESYLETLALYRKVAAALLDYDALVFHGSVVALDGRAYLFTAPSGTGKTTHTRLWLQEVPGAYVLNGDKPLLRLSEDGVLACGTPWQGKERLGCNEVLPLAGLCVLERDSYDHIEPLSFRDALPMLIRQGHRPEEVQDPVKAIQLIGEIGLRVRLWHLGCTMDSHAALVSCQAMTEGTRL